MVYIYDKIHGYVHFSENELNFLDNKWVKRLKRIKQLGQLDQVFPCASHSRFEHSIGVSHLAEKYCTMLNMNSNKKVFSNYFHEGSIQVTYYIFTRKMYENRYLTLMNKRFRGYWILAWVGLFSNLFGLPVIAFVARLGVSKKMLLFPLIVTFFFDIILIF